MLDAHVSHGMTLPSQKTVNSRLFLPLASSIAEASLQVLPYTLKFHLLDGLCLLSINNTPLIINSSMGSLSMMSGVSSDSGKGSRHNAWYLWDILGHLHKTIRKIRGLYF